MAAQGRFDVDKVSQFSRKTFRPGFSKALFLHRSRDCAGSVNMVERSDCTETGQDETADFLLDVVNWETGKTEFFGYQLQASKTRATRRPLVGGFSFHDVSGRCMNSLAGGIRAQGMRRRPVQTWVSCSGCWTTASDPHNLGCGSSVATSVTTKTKTKTKQKTTTTTTTITITTTTTTPSVALVGAVTFRDDGLYADGLDG